MSTRNQVDDFYQFWFNFESWRDYSYLDEEDKEKGQSREERRWIEKQNKVQRVKLKKEEMSRIRLVVEAAWNIDPRIALFKELERRAKKEKKLIRQRAAQEQKDEMDRVRLEAERRTQEEAFRQQAEEKERESAAKKIKEAQKKALKKERKTFRNLCKSNNYYSVDDNSCVGNMASVDELCEILQVEELSKLNKTLSALNLEDGRTEFERSVQKVAIGIAEEKAKTANAVYKGSGDLQTTKPNSERKTLEQWCHEETQLLIKAVNIFPAGTVQRWEVVANFINQHYQSCNDRKRTAKEVLAKAKELNSSDFSKSSLKEEANLKAYEFFERNNKSSGVVVETAETNGKVASSSAIPNATGDASSEASNVWTAHEQKLFEQALKTYPASAANRWDSISECVPGRTKKDCIARYKELAALVKAKKSAQGIKGSSA